MQIIILTYNVTNMISILLAKIFIKHVVISQKEKNR